METTALVVTAFIIGLSVYDLVVVVRTGVGISVSRFMQRTALKSPLVTFGVAFICGHLFGYMAPECPPCQDKIEHVESQSKDSEIIQWIKNLLEQKKE